MTSEVDRLIVETHRLLDANGLQVGPSKVTRLVRRYVRAVEEGASVPPFGYYLATQLSVARSARWVVEANRIRIWDDPTGEHAVSNVVRERGY